MVSPEAEVQRKGIQHIQDSSSFEENTYVPQDFCQNIGFESQISWVPSVAWLVLL